MAFYNEIDKYPAQWLRNLAKAGHIAPGVVDERSISDLSEEDLEGHGQCHFFAGIGGWSYALRISGWPDDAPVWTGSCPCQPFSSSGKQLGADDDRHLWPDWFRLISQRRPCVVFGEQVASGGGIEWLDAVSADMESIGYRFGATVLPAACVGAPHGRRRVFFVADTDRERGLRLVARRSSGAAGSWRGIGKEDLREVFNSPTVEGRSWPQPIIRKVDDGVPARVGRLRAYGNAIVPQVAAAFITAYMETL